MCGGGGGGNNAAAEESNNLAREQQEREEARRQEIQDNISKINFFFGGNAPTSRTNFDQEGFDKANKDFENKFRNSPSRRPKNDKEIMSVLSPKERLDFQSDNFDFDVINQRFEDQAVDFQKEKESAKPRREDFTTTSSISLPSRGADPNAAFARVRDDTFNLFLPELNDQRDKAKRSSKFQLARQGLLGGRAQVDNKAEITDRFNRGVNDISQRAIAAENEARAARQRTKAGLIARAQAGEDITGLLADAQGSLAAAAAQGRSSQAGRPLGSFFDNASSLFSDIAPKLNFGSPGGLSGKGLQQQDEDSDDGSDGNVFNVFS
jgi:hypothetical protein